MTIKPKDYVVDAWVSILRAQNRALGIVERAFKENNLPPFSWYDVLWELEKAGPEGIRPYKLEQRLLITQYGLSRLLSRLEKADYVRKVPHPKDARGHIVQITDEGRSIRAEMWQVYSQAIQTAVGDKISKDECLLVKELLSHVSK